MAGCSLSHVVLSQVAAVICANRLCVPTSHAVICANRLCVPTSHAVGGSCVCGRDGDITMYALLWLLICQARDQTPDSVQQRHHHLKQARYDCIVFGIRALIFFFPTILYGFFPPL